MRNVQFTNFVHNIITNAQKQRESKSKVSGFMYDSCPLMHCNPELACSLTCELRLLISGDL